MHPDPQTPSAFSRRLTRARDHMGPRPARATHRLTRLCLCVLDMSTKPAPLYIRPHPTCIPRPELIRSGGAQNNPDAKIIVWITMSSASQAKNTRPGVPRLFAETGAVRTGTRHVRRSVCVCFQYAYMCIRSPAQARCECESPLSRRRGIFRGPPALAPWHDWHLRTPRIATVGNRCTHKGTY
ncbi:hypothetical protein BD779DRAFT_1535477 [Infundibulicybe gibba]|nr:hypothetical protein BD779DRAFT_1535477 [Infundibulicybe gibba]